MFTKINVSHAYNYITLPKTYQPSRSGIMERYRLNNYCGKTDWILCNTPHCGIHVHNKLKDWHNQQIKDKLSKEECQKKHFLDCQTYYCGQHKKEKNQFYRITRELTQKGYNFDTHANKGRGNKALIKKYHLIIKGQTHNIKCKWCYKYQGKE
jgi:hypothetical protein